MPSTPDNQALVFGASGISGWAICKELLAYPNSGAFSRIVGLTNRPLSLKASGLPTDDPRLSLVSGVNLRGTIEDVKKSLGEKVNGLEHITHVYFTAYSDTRDHEELVRINVKMLENAAEAVSDACIKLEAFMLQTGGKYYGLEFADQVDITPPLKESFPRLSGPVSEKIFYYPQLDSLDRICAAAPRKWSWFEGRPDVIVGFVPNNNALNVAQPLALYFSLYRYVHGANAKVRFLGASSGWSAKHADTSQEILARSEIYISLQPSEKIHQQAFNISDHTEPTSWSYKWPKLASYFDLVGIGPDDEETAAQPEPADPGKWWELHGHEYPKFVQEKGLQTRGVTDGDWNFLRFITILFNFDRPYDLEKIRNLGFTEEYAPEESYFRAFDKMAKEKLIPGKDFSRAQPPRL